MNSFIEILHRIGMRRVRLLKLIEHPNKYYKTFMSTQKKHRFLFRNRCFHPSLCMETAGVEPASKGPATQASTRVD